MMQQATNAGGSPFTCDADYVNLQQSLKENHVCSRLCDYEHVLGNLWRCKTSGASHICDQNCEQRIFYDNHCTICRLSKRLFPNEAAMLDDRKRCAEDFQRPGSGKRANMDIY